MAPATPESPHGSLHDALEIRRARWLVDRLPIIYFGGGLSAFGLVLGLALTQPSAALWAWATASALYYLGCRQLNKQARKRPINELADARRWHRYTIAACVFQGLKWGAVAVLFFDPNGGAVGLLVLGILVSITAGAMVLLATHPNCYAVLLTLCISPLILVLVSADHAHWVLAGILLMSSVLAIYLVRHLHRGLMDAFELQLAHETLARQLSDEVTRSERALQEKSALLAFASHDLRNPIAALRLFAEELCRIPNRASLQPPSFHYAHFRDELQALSSLLDTALDSSVGRPQQGVDREQVVALNVLLGQAVARFQDSARARHIKLLARPTDVALSSHPVSLQRIIDNLISNAIRHSQGGTVLLCVRGQRQGCRLEVRDSGVGMPAVGQADLGEKDLATGHGAAHRHGMGLRIVGQLADTIGARIDTQSRQGRGTVVRVTLPNSVQPLQPAGVADSEPARAQA